MPANDEFGFGKHYFILDKKLENHINSTEAHDLAELKENFNNLKRFIEDVFSLPAEAENGTYILKLIKSNEGITFSWEKEVEE